MTVRETIEPDTVPDRSSVAPRRWWVTALWVAHGMLRIVLLLILLVYAWSKLLLGQMGQLDYADALVSLGQKSPMGLLWTFMAYSPVVQFLAGLVELVAAVLLVWRRTAWLGGVIGAVSLGTVFLLNLTYDVPVKTISLAMTVGFLLVAAPELGRLARFVAGRECGGVREPRPVPWPRVQGVSRWVLATLGLVVVAGAGLALWRLQPPLERVDVAPAGVYRVVADEAAPAARLADDQRWAQVAFGQWTRGDTARVAVSQANGDLRQGVYRRLDAGRLEVELDPVLRGDRPLVQPAERRLVLTWSPRPDGGIRLGGDGLRLELAPDPEHRYLFDRGFSWDGPVINR